MNIIESRSALINNLDIRVKVDRRNKNFQAFLYSLIKRRRKVIRRDGDISTNVYMDVHDPLTFLMFSSVIIFCVVDAIMTLFIIHFGGKEINPFMQYLMEKDIMIFFWVKFSVTSLGMLFLVSHKFFIFYRKIRGFHLIKTVFAMYLTLIVYELVILSNYSFGSA